MNQLNAIKVFIKVAELNSFSEAANVLELSSTAVSRIIKELEKYVGAQLLNRTTRAVHLTTRGRRYYEHGKLLLNNLEYMDGEAKSINTTPSGVLKITATTVFIREPFFNIIEEYLQHYPDVEIEIDYLDRIVDLAKEEYDLGIRLLLDIEENMIASKVGVSQPVTIASPDYLRKNGHPKTPESLTNHKCILDTNWPHKNAWPFKINNELTTFNVKGHLTVNNGEPARLAVLKGMGIAYMPCIYVADDLKSGKLEVVLEDYLLDPVSIYAVYPSNKYLPRTVTSFVDFVRQKLQKDRWDKYTRT